MTGYDFYTVQLAYLEDGDFDGCTHTVVDSVWRSEEEARAYVEAQGFEEYTIVGGCFGQELELVY